MSHGPLQPAALDGRWELLSEPVMIGGGAIQVIRPRCPDSLIDEADFDRDDRLPYWAELWPSSLVLAGRVAGWRGRGRRFLELGCGLGLVSLAAARAGYEVLATDYYAEALEFARANAAANGLARFATRLIDWRRLPTDLGTFDLVAASDVLYERQNVALVIEAFARCLSHQGLGLLSDPGRPPAAAFVPQCRARGLAVRPAGEVPVERGAGGPRIRVYEIRRA